MRGRGRNPWIGYGPHPTVTPEGGANGRPLFNPIRGCRVVVRVIPGLRPGLLKLDPVPGSPECHLNRLRDALGSPSAGSVLIPGLSTRAALSGRFQWGARFPGRRHAFRVTCPGLFQVAPSGLQKRGHNVAVSGLPIGSPV